MTATSIRSAARTIDGYVIQQKLKVVSSRNLLDSVRVWLVWEREPEGKKRWWLTLRLLSSKNDPIEGNSEDSLSRLESIRLQLECQFRGKQIPHYVITRLEFDPRHNLVSIPRVFEDIEPTELETVRLIPIQPHERFNAD